MLLDGLAVTFKPANGGQADTTVRPHFMLYVPRAQAPTPFVAPGAFTAEWAGVIHLDLRDRFVFQAELNGSLKLELNGTVVMEATSDGGTTDPTQRIRLNSRSNTLKATYTSPPKGDAFFRLYWATPDYGNEPIPAKLLKHSPNDPLAKGAALRRGRQLAAEHRCFSCHAADVPVRGMPELAMDAPALDGIGSRRDAGWMAKWILNPARLRPQATMPALLHGVADDANAIAAFLGSLKSGDNSPGEKVDAGSAGAGQKLFAELNCAACHTTAGQPAAEGKVALGQVRWKFGQAGSLAAFLRNPQAHYRWNRMPNFALTPGEAAALAAHLFQSANLAKRDGLAATAAAVGGMDSGLFGYQNDRDMVLSTLDTLRDNADQFDMIFSMIPMEGLGEVSLSDWLDFSLLPPGEKIAKYFDFTVYSAEANDRGISLKTFSPRPATLKR